MFITMPQLGETVTEGTIVRWCKAVGDVVAEDEPLFEVSTDKVDTEVPSAVAGVLSEILVAEGDTAAIGTRLAVVRTDQDDPTADGTRGDHGRRRARVGVADGRCAARPRRPGGRRPAPRRSDAGRLGQPRRRRRPDRGAGAPAGAAGRRPRRPGGQDGRRHDAGERPAVVPVAGAGDRVEPLSSVRRATGEHMRRSITTAAHTLVVMEADYSRVDRARAAVKEEFRTREGFGLTYLPVRRPRRRRCDRRVSAGERERRRRRARSSTPPCISGSRSTSSSRVSSSRWCAMPGCSGCARSRARSTTARCARTRGR